MMGRLKTTLIAIGVDPSKYSDHRFRRGDASVALQCSLPAQLIQPPGDWWSPAFQRYLDPSVHGRAQVSAGLARRVLSK